MASSSCWQLGHCCRYTTYSSGAAGAAFLSPVITVTASESARLFGMAYSPPACLAQAYVPVSLKLGAAPVLLYTMHKDISTKTSESLLFQVSPVCSQSNNSKNRSILQDLERSCLLPIAHGTAMMAALESEQLRMQVLTCPRLLQTMLDQPNMVQGVSAGVLHCSNQSSSQSSEQLVIVMALKLWHLHVQQVFAEDQMCSCILQVWMATAHSG